MGNSPLQPSADGSSAVPEISTSADGAPAEVAAGLSSAQYPTPKLAAFGYTVQGWLRDLDSRASPILDRRLTDTTGDTIVTGLDKAMELSRAFLSRCDELLKTDFGLDPNSMDPEPLLERGEGIVDELVELRRQVFRASGLCRKGIADGDSLLSSIVGLADHGFEAMHRLLNERVTILTLNPDFRIPFDPTVPLERAALAMQPFAEERERLMHTLELDPDLQTKLLRNSLQGTKLFQLMEVVGESAAFDGSVVSAHEDFLQMIRPAVRVFHLEGYRVLKESPPEAVDALSDYIVKLTAEVNLRIEKLKLDLREAFQRIWGGQE